MYVLAGGCGLSQDPLLSAKEQAKPWALSLFAALAVHSLVCLIMLWVLGQGSFDQALRAVADDQGNIKSIELVLLQPTLETILPVARDVSKPVLNPAVSAVSQAMAQNTPNKVLNSLSDDSVKDSVKPNTEQAVQPQASVQTTPQTQIQATAQGQTQALASQNISQTASVSVAIKATLTENVKLPSTNASYLKNAPPTAPYMSRKLGEYGTVSLRVLVDISGAVSAIAIKSSSGYARLDDAAKAAVEQWRFVAGTRNGAAEPMWVVVPIEFASP